MDDHVEMSRTIMTSIDHNQAVEENKYVPMNQAASPCREFALWEQQVNDDWLSSRETKLNWKQVSCYICSDLNNAEV